VEVCDTVALPETAPVPFAAEVVGKLEFVPRSTVCDGEGASVALPVPILLAPFGMVPIKLIRLDEGIVIVEEYVV
jgi:hypothetical protein